MRNILIISILFILFSSCSKNSASLNDTSKPHADSLAIIMNNWMLIQDSLYGHHNTIPDSVNTIGKEGDTWNFKAGNILEINETNIMQANIFYQFTNDSKLEIPLPEGSEPATILLLNSNNLIFYWNYTDPSSAIFYYRKIVLKR